MFHTALCWKVRNTSVLLVLIDQRVNCVGPWWCTIRVGGGAVFTSPSRQRQSLEMGSQGSIGISSKYPAEWMGCSQWSGCSRDETKPSTTEVQLDSVVWASLENMCSGRSRPVLSLYDCAIRAWSSHKQGGAALDLFDCPLRRPVLFPPLGWGHVEGLGLAF